MGGIYQIEKKNAKKYYELFERLSDRVRLTPYCEENSFFLFQIFTKDKSIRDSLILHLKEKKIGCSIHYAVPVPMMSYYQKKYEYTLDMFPNAIEYTETNISLPVHPYLKDSEIYTIFKVISDFLTK